MTDDYTAARLELENAERITYRAACKVRCLEANLTRIEPEDFERLMDELETARREASTAVLRELWARLKLGEMENRYPARATPDSEG